MSIFHPRYLFENCPYSMKPYSSQILTIPMIIWHRAELLVVDRSHLQGNQRSPLTSRGLLRVTCGIERTFPRPFSETFRISKNADFKGPYLENEFFKKIFKTVFTASKSRDRDQLVSAFQLTFNEILISLSFFAI